MQAAAFLYTASTQGMTGEGWIYLGTDWNSVLTYAGLEKEYRETVRNAMNGMVGISPFVGDLDWMVTEINVIFGMVEEGAEVLEGAPGGAGGGEGGVRQAAGGEEGAVPRVHGVRVRRGDHRGDGHFGGAEELP